MQTATAADGATIAYDARGVGPSLVLVHGITESHRTWDPLVDELALDAQVLTVDLRGHGESERRPPYDALTLAGDLHSVVEAAGVIDPLLVGHSLGGMVVSLYASAHPVRGVVNLDQLLDVMGFKQLLDEIEPILRGDEAGFRGILDAMVEANYGPLPAAERERIAQFSHHDRDVVLGVWDQVLTTDVADLRALIDDEARGLTAPYLALYGSDPGPEYRDWLAAAVPSSTLEVWDGDGHYPHLVERERFLARIHEFAHAI